MESLYHYVRSFFISDISNVIVSKTDSSDIDISCSVLAVVPVSSMSPPKELTAPVSLDAELVSRTVPEPEPVPNLPTTQPLAETKIDPIPVTSTQTSSTPITTPPSQSSEHKQTKKHKKRKN